MEPVNETVEVDKSKDQIPLNDTSVAVPFSETSTEVLRLNDKYTDVQHFKDTSCQELTFHTPYLTEEELMAKFYPCTDRESKAENVLSVLYTEPRILDFRLTLYIAACNGGQLIPFPVHMVEDSYEGLQALLLLNSKIPPLALLLKYLKEDCKIDDHIINLMDWLISLPGPKYVIVRPSEIPEILLKVDTTCSYDFPHNIFKVMINKTSQNHLLWSSTKKGEDETKFAFYCGVVDRLHSLTNLGFYPFHKTVGPKGRGVYLTDNLELCLENSQSQWVWGKSSFGVELQTVVIVEFICDPDVIEYIDSTEELIDEHNNMLCHKIKYYFVPDPHLIQLRYVLLYARTPSKIGPDSFVPIKDPNSRHEGNWNRVLVLAGYILAGYFILTTYKLHPKIKSVLETLKAIKLF